MGRVWGPAPIVGFICTARAAAALEAAKLQLPAARVNQLLAADVAKKEKQRQEDEAKRKVGKA